MPPPELLTKAYVAEYLHTPEATLDYWRSKGLGPRWIKVGRKILYPAAALERYIAGLTRGAQR